MKKAHVTRRVRGRERKAEPSFTCGKVFFPTKFLSNRCSLLTSGMFHIQKASFPTMSVPSVFKGEARIDRRRERGGKGSLTDDVWAHPKGVVTLSL